MYLNLRKYSNDRKLNHPTLLWLQIPTLVIKIITPVHVLHMMACRHSFLWSLTTARCKFHITIFYMQILIKWKLLNCNILKFLQGVPTVFFFFFFLVWFCFVLFCFFPFLFLFCFVFLCMPQVKLCWPKAVLNYKSKNKEDCSKPANCKNYELILECHLCPWY